MLEKEEKSSSGIKIIHNTSKEITVEENGIHDESINIVVGGNIPGNVNTGTGTIQDNRQDNRKFFYEAAKLKDANLVYKPNQLLNKEALEKDIIQSLKKRYKKPDMALEAVLKADTLDTEAFTPSICYINLALVEEGKSRLKRLVKEEEKTKALETDSYRDERIASYEDLYNVRKPLATKAIFDLIKIKRNNQPGQYQCRPVRKIFVVGRAGIGKTMLCHQFADLWKKDELPWKQKFQVVLLVHLRVLANQVDVLKKEGYKGFFHYETQGKLTAQLGWIVEKLLLPATDEFNRHTLHQYLKDNTDQVLWLLDGYDEVADRVDCPKDDLSILFQTLCQQRWVILTSRPGAKTDPNQFKPHRVIENMGFINENIKAYVTAYFQQDDRAQETDSSDEEEKVEVLEDLPSSNSKAAQILKWLEGNTRLWGIAHIPINLRLICGMFQGHEGLSSDLKKLPSNLGGLYTQLVEKTKARKIRQVRNARNKRKEKIPLFPLLKTDWLKEKDNQAAYPSLLSWQSKSKGTWSWSDIAERYLMRLGFEAMAQEQIILSPKLLKETAERHIKAELGVKLLEEDGELEGLCQCLLQACHHLGFLKVTGRRDQVLGKIKDKRSDTEDFLGCSHVFIHLSFQEYFAARWVAKHLSAKEKCGKLAHMIWKAVRENKYHPRYQLVWWFTAGYLAYQEDVKGLSQWFRWLYEAPKDLIGLQNARLLMHSLEEILGYEAGLKSKAIKGYVVTPLKDYFQSAQARYDCKATSSYQKLLDELVRCGQLWSLEWIQNIWLKGYTRMKPIQDRVHAKWLIKLLPHLTPVLLEVVSFVLEKPLVCVSKEIEYVREEIARETVFQWSRARKPLITLLKNTKVSKNVRVELATALGNQWSRIRMDNTVRSSLVVLLDAKISKIDESIRVYLTKGLVSHWLHLLDPEKKTVLSSVTILLSLDSKVDKCMRVHLVREVAAQWLNLFTHQQVLLPYVLGVLDSLRNDKVFKNIQEELCHDPGLCHDPVSLLKGIDALKNRKEKEIGVELWSRFSRKKGHLLTVVDKKTLKYSDGKQLQSLALQEDTLQLIQEQFEVLKKNMPKPAEEAEEKRDDRDTQTEQEAKKPALSIDQTQTIAPMKASDLVDPSRSERTKLIPSLPVERREREEKETGEDRPKPSFCEKCVIL